MAAAPPVTVIIPTHAHATTLELACRSVLEQSMTHFDLVVIGDGVENDTREVMYTLLADDERITFIDRPKAPRHGEILRHEVLAGTSSPVIAYHGDDDLLLPDHLEIMLGMLKAADFVHPLPIVVDAEGALMHLPTDLSMEQCRAWHLGHPPRNAISLTGVVHTLAAYRRLPHGWRTTPPGRWTDHYMWQQFLELRDLRAMTSTRATTIKLAAGHRESMDARERGDEVREWWTSMHEPGFRDSWDQRVAEAVRLAAVQGALSTASLQHRTTALEDEVAGMTHCIARLEAESRVLQTLAADESSRADTAEGEAAEAQRTVDQIVASRSWRLTAPMRGMRERRRWTDRIVSRGGEQSQQS